MNYAVIIAGGSGKRMGQSIPKQFLNINDKPIIIYTLEAFQKEPTIDAICVVCIEGWESILTAYAEQFNITKLKWIVNGGKNGQESIYNGLKGIEGAKEDDIILVHDAIRPLVSSDIINDCIMTCQKHGNAIVTIPCNEAMLYSENGLDSEKSIDRSTLKRTQTPQAVKYKDFIKLHEDALKAGITNSIATCTLLVEMGHKIYFSLGSEKNVKLTTVEDIDIFQALLYTKRNSFLKR